jgi:hypothetical protein
MQVSWNIESTLHSKILPVAGRNYAMAELVCTITRVFTEMQSHPELIRPCLRFFC